MISVEPLDSILSHFNEVTNLQEGQEEFTYKTLLYEALQTIRSNLEMEVAFISEFTGDRRIFLHVASDRENCPVKPGMSDPLDESYCQRVVDGRLPQIIQDATQLEEALKLPVTKELPVRAHISVPICFSDGSIFGTFCCFSTTSAKSLNKRDLGMMRLFADFASKQLERQVMLENKQSEARHRINQALQKKAFAPVYQPIFNLASGDIAGFEALTRFSLSPTRTPDLWFAEAKCCGLQVELELTAIAMAVKEFSRLPGDGYLALNISPETALCEALDEMLLELPFERLVLEITEHVVIDDYQSLREALIPLREKGVLLAVDDAGAGYASFSHILQLEPDFIKLDRSLTAGLDTRIKSRALAASLIGFAEQTGSTIIAEGVETETELQILKELGVGQAQGYLFGRPLPFAEYFNTIPGVFRFQKNCVTR